MSTANYINACDGKTIQQFENKDRLFDPTTDPRYANDLGLPTLLMKYIPMIQINQLHVGLEYGGEHVHSGFECAEQDTVVMVVGALSVEGHTAGARFFGKDSEYNRNSFVAHESEKSVIDQLLSTTCVGCNTIRNITNAYPRIKKAYIMTSSNALIEGVTKLFEWTMNGFPASLPENMSSMLLGLLRGHLNNFDTTGVEVKFWKVAPEFITGPAFPAENQLLDYFKVPHVTDPDACHCSDCIDAKQYRELKFAKYGMACCACHFGVQLATKYGQLQKSDKFTITNNAGVTEATVVMRVDGKGMVFQE